MTKASVLVIALTSGLLLCCLSATSPAAAADQPSAASGSSGAPSDLPVAPPVTLPGPDTPFVLFVATEPSRRADLAQRGYPLYDSISQAVEAANPGTVIFVTAGKYLENLQLYARKALTITCEEGTTLVAENDSHCVEISGCNGIWIHNLDVVHKIGENPCYHNCYVISESQNVLVDYCDISGCGYTGVAVNGYESLLRNIRVENCAIHDCQIAVDDASFGELTLSGNVIWNCKEQILAPQTDQVESEVNEPPAEPEVPNIKPDHVPESPPAVMPVPSTDKLIVVAQDPSRRKELSDAGYWCTPTVQRALDNADDGFTIFVTQGKYAENLRIIGLKNLILLGEEGVLVVADNDQEVCFIQECQDLKIHNIDVVHQIGADPCLHNCFVVWDAQDVQIEYCDISGCGYIGVEVLGNGASKNVAVEHCAIHDCQVAYYDVAGDALKVFDNVLWNIMTIAWTI